MNRVPFHVTLNNTVATRLAKWRRREDILQAGGAYQLGNPISSLWPNALLVLFFKIVPVRLKASKQAG